MADEMADYSAPAQRSTSRDRMGSSDVSSRRARTSSARMNDPYAEQDNQSERRERRAKTEDGNPFLNVLHNVGNAAGNAVSRIQEAASAARGSAAAREAQDEAEQDSSSARSDSDYMGTGTPCRKCGRPVEHDQLRCPHCGSLQKPIYTNPYLLVPLVAAAVLVIVLTVVFSSCVSATSTTDKGASQAGGADTSAANGDSIDVLNSVINTTNDQYLNANASAHTYTEASIANVQAQLASAQAVASAEKPSTSDVENAVSSLRSSLDALVQRTAYADLTWPYYDDLNANVTSYTGSQIAMNGLVLSTHPTANGNLAYVAISGDLDCIVALSYSSTILSNTAVSQSATVDFGGVVTGTASYTGEDGAAITVPAITADEIFAPGTSADTSSAPQAQQ